MKPKPLTQAEAKAEFIRRIEYVISNKHLRSRQQHIYEIRKDQPSFEIGDNLKAALKAEGLKWE